MKSEATLKVRVSRQEGLITLTSQDDIIHIQSNAPSKLNKYKDDFAVWYFLPVAMKNGVNLHIEGEGAKSTVENARRISEIWEYWLPTHFSSVEISFDKYRENSHRTYTGGKEICFYSGGIDSTYTILKRFTEGKRQSLLTVHGMDYKVDDETKFNELVEKTSWFAELAGEDRILIRSNAIGIYKRYKVDPPQSHIRHIFSLAGAGFLHSEIYQHIIVASDHRLDQQFLTHPYGSNSATNSLFNDGESYLMTDAVDLSRSEKLPLLLTSPEALKSLAFCSDYKSRPRNCGVCHKCMRTKLMFFAATGVVPSIFDNMIIPENWQKVFNLNNNYHRSWLIELITCAKRNGRIGSIPGAISVYESLKNPPPSTKNIRSRISSFFN